MKDRMLSKEVHEKLMGEIGRNDKFIELMGIRIVEVDEGYCKGELEVTDQHMNPLGTVHGGCLYTLADTVAGFAAASCGFEGPTLSGNMYFLRPTMGVKKLTCESVSALWKQRFTVIMGRKFQEVFWSIWICSVK